MRPLLVFLSLVLAWHYGNIILSGSLAAIPFVGSLLVWLFPDITGKDVFFYVKVLLAAWLFYHLSGPLLRMFGFALPISQSYSTTKLARRLHGLFADLLIIECLFLLVAAHAIFQPIVDPSFDSLPMRKKLSETLNLPDRVPSAVRELVGDNSGGWGLSLLSGQKLDQVLTILENRQATDDGNLSDGNYVRRYPKSDNDIEAKRKRVYELYEARAVGVTEADLRKYPFTYVAALNLSLWKSNGLLYICILWLFGNPLKAFFSSVHKVLLKVLDVGRMGRGGSARFASLIEEWGLRLKYGSGDLFLGRSLYSRFFHVGLKDDRHMLTIAGSRGGKGTTAIIPNLLLWEGSALVIDPKGTNAAVTAERRRKMGHSVHIVDPFNVLRTGKSAAFNPLSMLDLESREIREQIAVIAEALVVPDPEAKDKHWDDGARTVLSGLIAHLISSYDKPALFHIRSLLSMSEEDQIELWADMSLNEAAGGAAKEAANRILRGLGKGGEISGILSNADKHSEWLSSLAIQGVLGLNTFFFAEMKEKPTTIYLILPPHYLDTHNRFLRLFVNLAIKQMSMGGRSKVPVLMILDEFLALGHMAEVEKAFGLMAGYNFVLWPFVQDLGRLRDLYKNSVNSFINNSRAVQVFAVSDEATTKFVSERIGERSMQNVFGMGQSQRTAPLRTTTELAKEISAESGYQYILRAGKAPLIIEKVPYFEGNTLLKKLEELRVPLWLLSWLYPFAGLYAQDPDYR